MAKDAAYSAWNLGSAQLAANAFQKIQEGWGIDTASSTLQKVHEALAAVPKAVLVAHGLADPLEKMKRKRNLTQGAILVVHENLAGRARGKVACLVPVLRARHQKRGRMTRSSHALSLRRR